MQPAEKITIRFVLKLALLFVLLLSGVMLKATHQIKPATTLLPAKTLQVPVAAKPRAEQEPPMNSFRLIKQQELSSTL
ncbi:hypothetical protein I2I11_03525 [Pontibacter sp. 172403-2]|nr:hypothetical protein [Pontibacter sp. 172403-2]